MRMFFLTILTLCFFETAIAQPNVGKKKFYLFLLAGQSNMAGRGSVEAEDQKTNGHIWALNKNNEWVIASEPLHFDKPGITGVGPGFAFAKKLADIDTNIVIGLIPCAVGGSPIEVWQARKYYEATKSYPYDDAIRRTKLAMQKGTLKGVLWHQGESDSDSIRAKTYSGNLSTLIKSFRKDLKIKKLPFVAATLADFYVADHPDAKLVNAAIEELPAKLKRTGVAKSEGLIHKGDKVHFNSASARELGRRYAEVFLKFFHE